MKTLALLTALALVPTAARGEIAYSGRACASGEAWDFDGAMGEWANDWQAYRSKRKPAVRAFADAWAFRRVARGPAEKAFAEYWLTRTLDELGMTHLAYTGFSALAAKTLTPATLVIQTAALDCLTHLQERYPTLEMPKGVVANLPLFPRNEALHRAALQEMRRRVGLGRPADEVKPMLGLLENGGPYEILGRVLFSAHTGDHNKTIEAAQAFLSPSFSMPAGLERFTDSVRLLLGRSLFTNGRFNDAAEEFKRVRKNSNELARSLSDLAWAQLRQEKYPEAVGTVINLQSGSLRRTFTPEAPMVMAMAFNEVCQYPESLKVVQFFRGSYGAAYEWLQGWKERGGNEAIYPKALSFMKKSADGLPEKVAVEWTRSPHFIARQDEIRQFFAASERAKVTGEQAAQLSRKMAIELLEFIKEFKPRYDAAKAAAELRAPSSETEEVEGKALPRAIQMDIDRMRAMLTQWRRLRRAAQPWQAMVKGFEKRAPARKTELVAEIDRELNTLNLRMLMQLDEIAENLHFLEVEIYQGATQDIIWQNAHPDYKELVMTFKKESSRADLTRNWNWGAIKGGLAGTHEVWDDELGSFKADLFDNCSSKDKYMSVKSRSARN